MGRGTVGSAGVGIDGGSDGEGGDTGGGGRCADGAVRRVLTVVSRLSSAIM